MVDKINSMEGKVVLITGANSGIGKETAKELAKMGASIVMLCRNQQKAEEARSEIISKTGNNNIDVLLCDLSSMKSVCAAADEFKKKYSELHVLINNAAHVGKERHETDDGYEMSFAVNYLSHFLLTHLLLDILKKSTPSRIVNIASKHNGISINLDDLMLTKNYSFFRALGQTKLALVYFTKELSQKIEGTGVTVNSLHPGVLRTNLGVYKMGGAFGFIFGILKRFLPNAENHVQTPVYVASSQEIEGVSGQYFENCKAVSTYKTADDPELGKKLWEESKKLTGI